MKSNPLLAASLAALLAVAVPSLRAEEAPVDIEEEAATPTAAELDGWRKSMLEMTERQRKAYENLKASASPRDWAIASQIHVNVMDFGPDGQPKFDSEKAERLDADRAELLRNAAAGAPSDKLVQWLALHEMPHAGGGCSSSALPAERIEAVQGLEPDNGLAWLSTLAAATLAKDDFAIDEALARMAAAKRYDNHVVDYTLALVDTAKRHPGVLGMPVDEKSGIAPEQLALIGAFGVGRSLSTTSYAFGEVCDAGKQVDADLRRFAACADLGRRLSREAATFDLRKLGFELLRQSAQADETDLAAERDLDWLGYQIGQVVRGGNEEKMKSFLAEGSTAWFDKRDDVAVLEALFKSRGIPVTAPAGWQPPAGSVVE